MQSNLIRFGALWATLLVLVSTACNHSVDDIGIVRDPDVSLEINGTDWQPQNSMMIGVGQELVYEEDTSDAGVLYYGYRLILNGRSESGFSRKVTIRFAVQQRDQLRGMYTYKPAEHGQIVAVEMLEQISNQEYAYYQLAEADSTSFLKIDRQSTSQNLVAGTFSFSLVNMQDSTQTITGTNGTFTDISYQKWQNSNL